MKAVIKPLVLFGTAASVSLAGWWLVGPGDPDGRTASLLASPAHSFGLGAYELEDLQLAESTLYEIDKSYVDPGRVDRDRMYEAALDAIERRVPTVLFRRVPGSALVHVQVGEHRSVVEVGEIVTAKELLTALRDVVGIVAEHVDPDDVRVEQGTDPMASIEYAVVNGMLGTLDPHSRLLPPEDSREMDVENSGEFGGLGITIIERDGVLTIDYPLPDTPAAEAGLLSDDRIVRIDGESTINMGLDEAVERLRGRVGSKVVISIERDREPEPFDVTITRDRIKMNPVEGDLLDGGIGIVSIKSFHANVAADLETTLGRLAREAPGGELRGLIVDLRGNPGGYLHQAVAVADKFLEEGDIVSTKARGKVDDEEFARPARTEPRYPIAVLVNASSASASEIVAGALRNNERAVIIGERSFGKGSVQNLDGLSDGSKLKLTIAQYYTGPADRSIQSVGIPADLELVPSIVQARADGGVETALVYWRERVRREADFDNHLERSSTDETVTRYSLRYLRPKDLRRKDSSLRHLRGDPEVVFARDVLIAAGRRARTADILSVVGPVVDSARRRGDADIAGAFQELGVDWSAGPSLESAQIEARLDLGDDGQLVAGQEETLWLEVTNRGDEPIHRLAAVSSSDAEILDGREFFFGRLDPGETLRWSQDVVLNDGYPTEHSPVSFAFRDVGNDALYTWQTRLPVQGHPLPRLDFSYTVEDLPHGDGDGIPEPGERVSIKLTVENTGQGPTSEAFARLKNHSRKALDLELATLEPGFVRTADGQDCPVLEAGVENGTTVVQTVDADGNPLQGDAIDEESAARIAAGDPPVYAQGCSRTLAPGESWTGRFVVLLNESSDPWEVELSVGDARSYDHAAVMRSGFYDTFTDKVRISIDPESDQGEGAVIAASRSFSPPSIEVGKELPPVVDRSLASLSGMVFDDSLAHVTVWLDDEKVALADGGGLEAIPFSADVELQPGLNTLAVVATDEDGLTSTHSTVVYYEPPEVTAKAPEQQE